MKRSLLLVLLALAACHNSQPGDYQIAAATDGVWRLNTKDGELRYCKLSAANDPLGIREPKNKQSGLTCIGEGVVNWSDLK